MDESMIDEDNSQQPKQEAEVISEDLINDYGHERVIDLIVKKDDITWKTIILELVNSKKMNPWNIDIKLLTKEYLLIVKQLKNHDFRISGKIILAAAMLLKLKSTRLLEGDLNELDILFSSAQETDEDDLGMVDEILPNEVKNIEIQKLIPRTPQPRKRKVSIYDLVDALEKALEVKERRVIRGMPSLEMEIPKKKLDVSILMGHLYERITTLFTGEKSKKVYFSDLTPGNTREDKVITFIPLLHLTNQRKIDLEQKEHFGAIQVLMNENSEIQQEITKELNSEINN